MRFLAQFAATVLAQAKAPLFHIIIAEVNMATGQLMCHYRYQNRLNSVYQRVLGTSMTTTGSGNIVEK